MESSKPAMPRTAQILWGSVLGALCLVFLVLGAKGLSAASQVTSDGQELLGLVAMYALLVGVLGYTSSRLLFGTPSPLGSLLPAPAYLVISVGFLVGAGWAYGKSQAEMASTQHDHVFAVCALQFLVLAGMSMVAAVVANRRSRPTGVREDVKPVHDKGDEADA